MDHGCAWLLLDLETRLCSLAHAESRLNLIKYRHIFRFISLTAQGSDESDEEDRIELLERRGSEDALNEHEQVPLTDHAQAETQLMEDVTYTVDKEPDGVEEGATAEVRLSGFVVRGELGSFPACRLRSLHYHSP